VLTLKKSNVSCETISGCRMLSTGISRIYSFIQGVPIGNHVQHSSKC
jgi:hypothetical protein